MSEEFKILFAGDVFIGQNSGSEILNNDLKKIIDSHEIKSCNFEAPLITNGSAKIPKAGTYLEQSELSAEIIINSGFNLISLANNHIYDFGDIALFNTLEKFSNVTTVGAGKNFSESYALKKIKIKTTSIGFLSFCESEFGALADESCSRGGYAWINHPSVNKLISDSKKQVDILIIQIHAGVEEIELPLPEWRTRYKECLDLGGDLIVGHHPHVPQGWEIHNGKYIFYSLGNFYFDMQSSYPEWNKSFLVSTTIFNKKIQGIEIIPIIRNANLIEINQDDEYNQYLNTLCGRLLDSSYINEINKIAINLWNTRYKKYYKNSVNGFLNDDSVLRIFKVLIKKLFYARLEKDNLLLLLHSIRIESHRWIVQRALSLLVKEK